MSFKQQRPLNQRPFRFLTPRNTEVNGVGSGHSDASSTRARVVSFGTFSQRLSQAVQGARDLDVCGGNRCFRSVADSGFRPSRARRPRDMTGLPQCGQWRWRRRISALASTPAELLDRAADRCRPALVGRPCSSSVGCPRMRVGRRSRAACAAGLTRSQACTASVRPHGSRRLPANDRGPLTDAPASDQAVLHVGIRLCKSLRRRR